jgi:carbonic anhydrase/acetyltransferase-like protein (isoleucine patch superfamily)
MKALIIATGQPQATEAAERPPAFLLPLIDRPFLQHVVEFVAEAGVVDGIDVVLNHMPEKVEALLGDGTRWGVPIRYHLVRDAARPYAMLGRLPTDGPVFLLHSDCLPLATLKECANSLRPVVFCSAGDWTGWMLLDPATLSCIEADWDRDRLSRFVIDSANHFVVSDCPVVLSVRSEAEFLVSQRTALDKRFPNLMFYGREVQEGVWISRNVTLHPTANLVPPVYLGENCRIGAGTRLGPNVVVVRDCMLDSGSTVENSAILPGSYVGQALELDHVIVERNRLINVRAGGETIVRDDFILSGITRTSFHLVLANLVSRIAALMLFFFTWPAVLLTMVALRLFRRGPVVNSFNAVQLPAAENRWEWKTFELNSFASPDSNQSAPAHLFLRFLPGLINVLRGQLNLVGVAARSPDEVLALPADWRILYLQARPGLITEAFALHGAYASPDQLYSSEAFYSVASGARHDTKIILRYLGRMFQPHQAARHSVLSGAKLDLK